MTVLDIIKMLSEPHVSPDAEVETFDAQSQSFQPITGMIYDNDIVTFETDDIS